LRHVSRHVGLEKEKGIEEHPEKKKNRKSKASKSRDE
jgi:hypothetical protein